MQYYIGVILFWSNIILEYRGVMSLTNCCYCLESCEVIDLDAWADDIMSSTEVHSSQMHTQTDITSMLSKEGKLFTIYIKRPPTLTRSSNEQLNREINNG